MKNKLLKIFLAFVRKTFTKERLLDLIDDLLDILYARFYPMDGIDEFRMLDQVYDLEDAKEVNSKDGV